MAVALAELDKLLNSLCDSALALYSPLKEYPKSKTLSLPIRVCVKINTEKLNKWKRKLK